MPDVPTVKLTYTQFLGASDTGRTYLTAGTNGEDDAYGFEVPNQFVVWDDTDAKEVEVHEVWAQRMGLPFP